jgi:hypothetical protein
MLRNRQFALTPGFTTSTQQCNLGHNHYYATLPYNKFRFNTDIRNTFDSAEESLLLNLEKKQRMLIEEPKYPQKPEGQVL